MKALLHLGFRSLCWFLITAGLVGFAPLPQAGEENGTLTVLVRDVAGTSLAEVTVNLYEVGPPHRAVDDGVTDTNGTVRFAVRPGLRYLIAFEGEWEDYRFIEESEQNFGAFASNSRSGGGGGFAIRLDQASTEFFFTFTVALSTDKELVPFFDMSRDINRPPEPFTYDNIESDEIGVLPESMRPTVVFSPIATPNIYTFVEVIEEARGEAEPVVPEPEVTTTKRSSTIAEVTALVLALITVILVLGVMWFVILRNSRGGGIGRNPNNE